MTDQQQRDVQPGDRPEPGRSSGPAAGPRPTLIFDLGGVLVDWDPRHLMTSVIPDPERREWFLEHVASRDFLHEVDSGRPFPDAAADRARAHPDWADELTAYAERWPETIRGSIPGTEQLLRDLHDAGAPLFALSNWPADTFWVAHQRFAVLEVFADIVVSGEVGLVKPDPAIYTLALDRFGRTAGECVFVDDRPDNVAAAASVGIEGVRFAGADLLREHPAVAAWLRA